MNGWIMFLFLLMIASLAVRSFYLWSSLPATAPRGISMYGHDEAAFAGFKMGLWLGPILAPLLALGLAWIVGWIVSLMFGKSDDAGNIGAGVVMLGLLTLFGYGTYTTIAAQQNQPPGATASAQTDGTQPFGSSPSIRQRMTQSPPQPAAIDNSQPLQPAAPLQMAPPQVPQPRPAPTQRPSSSPTANNDAVSRPIIDALAAELKTKIDAFADSAAKLLPQLSRPPAHDLTKIKALVAETEAFGATALAVKRSLDSAQNTLGEKLRQAGLSDSDAHLAAFLWSTREYNCTLRGFMVSDLIRMCDKSKEECDFLRDNFGKWTLDAKGEIKCSDSQIKSKIHSNRFMVKSDADRKDYIIDQLRGK
jgi:hypothetical protein